ncbi:hypothetical protein [Chryseobacterium sp. HR92]|uniref:hypothetical protein n=1 Tax=Chryseobacterium sp. HR92 TaxID=3094839 RepID=UPI00389018F6|nr:hypothetical protein SFA27_17020 [Chryseobacterium sp. HR92]
MPSINDVQNYFNTNPRPVSSTGNDDGQSINERNALFGISIETLGAEHIGLWVQYISNSDKHYRKYENLMAEIHVKKEELKQKTLNSESERTLREKNAVLAFRFSALWASFIGLFILLHGIKFIKVPFFTKLVTIPFTLSETEFIFVCGTLTASILIFYLTVIKNLFPNKIEDKQSQEKK